MMDVSSKELADMVRLSQRWYDEDLLPVEAKWVREVCRELLMRRRLDEQVFGGDVGGSANATR